MKISVHIVLIYSLRSSRSSSVWRAKREKLGNTNLWEEDLAKGGGFLLTNQVQVRSGFLWFLGSSV
jgi:hypothetical protein